MSMRTPRYGNQPGIRRRGLARRMVVALSASALALLFLLLCLQAIVPGVALAQERQFHMSEYNADITVNKDGSLDVTETLVYIYDQGIFRRATRIIPLDRVESITDVRVAEVKDGQTVQYTEAEYDFAESSDYSTAQVGTFGTSIFYSNNELNIRWRYDDVLSANTSKTFKVSYHVTGAIRVYDDRDELDWYAVPQDWAGTIYSSRVQVSLPQGVDTSQLQIASNPSAKVERQSNAIVWTADRNLQDGFELGLRLPKGALAVTKPTWQANVEAVERAEAQRKQMESLLVVLIPLAAGLILAVGVPMALVRWYKLKGQQSVGLYSDYLAEPPSDLPPGLVGTLVDDSADVQDVIATVLDLGRKGNLEIEVIPSFEVDYEYHLKDTRTDYDFEKTVLDAVFEDKRTVRLSSLEEKFYLLLYKIYDDMYQALVEMGYFPDDPRRPFMSYGVLGWGLAVIAVIALISAFWWAPFSLVLLAVPMGIAGLVVIMFSWAPPRAKGFTPDDPRRAYTSYVGLGQGLVVLAVLSIISAFWWVERSSAPLVVLAASLGVTGLVWILVGRALLRKTRKTMRGLEEVEKWMAFSRYLSSIRKYTGVKPAADKYELYLPYAVALGVDASFTRQFRDVPNVAPEWYTERVPHTREPAKPATGSASDSFDPWWREPRRWTAERDSARAPAGSGQSFNPAATVQSASDSMARGVQNMSNSLAAMVNSAASVFVSTPPPPSSSSSSWSSSDSWSSSSSSSSSSSGGSWGGGGSGGGRGGAD